jgi:hypothetical protein
MDKYEKALEKLKQNFENEKSTLINTYEKKIKELEEEVIKKLQKALEEANLKNQEGVMILLLKVKICSLIIS